MVSDEELRKKAKKRAEEKTGFYVHFTIYVIVNLGLFAMWWFLHGPGTHPWPIWTTFGWGIGIAAHFIAVYTSGGFQEKLVEKEYKKLKEK